MRKRTDFIAIVDVATVTCATDARSAASPVIIAIRVRELRSTSAPAIEAGEIAIGGAMIGDVVIAEMVAVVATKPSLAHHGWRTG